MCGGVRQHAASSPVADIVPTVGRSTFTVLVPIQDLIPVLSKWDERVVGIHERAQVGEPRGEVGQGMDAQPGQQEAGTDEGLEEEPQVGESMLPTGVLRPGRMLTRHGGRSRGRRGSGRVRCGHCRCHCQRGRLPAHEQIGAQHEFPPARDAPSRGQPVIGPAQFILGVLEALLDPGTQPERVAHVPHRARDLAGQVGHEVPRGLRRQMDGIGGEHVLAGAPALAKDARADETPFGRPIGEDAREGAPARLAHALTGKRPDHVVGADRHHVGPAQVM